MSSSVYLLIPPTHAFASDPISAWTSATNLPLPLASQSLQTYNNRLILLGGANISVYPENISATINQDGSINNWTSSQFPFFSLLWHNTIINNSRIYVLGGETYPPATSVNTVYTSTLDDGGINSAWTQLTPLPQKLAVGGTVILNNRIYYAGGIDNSNTAQQTIYVAPLNPDGTIGSWTVAGNLPEALDGFGMVTNGNNMVVVGGNDVNNQAQAQVYTAPVNPDGTVGLWTTTSMLPQGVFRSSVVKVGSKVVSLGGANNSIILEQVYYADLNSDGTVGQWQASSNFLPQPLCCSATAATDDYIYLTGGLGNGGYLNTVYYSKINKANDLNVPLIKQTSLSWKSQEYDSAHLWNPQDPTINAWGCALTSATMIFRYYGINELPDGKLLDPGTLNKWLESQPDGYVNEGWVNWLALTRLSKLATTINNIVSFDALEYQKIKGSTSQLTGDINNQQPDILEEPGHFIVAKGTNGTTFDINDPYYNRTTLNDGYNNSFLSIGQYVPSHTDLSYIMAVSTSDITMQIFNNQKNTIANSFIQQPIIDPLQTSSKNSPISLVYLAKPSLSAYLIKATGTSTNPYKITLYFYDKNGNVTIATESGIISPKSSDSFSISFDPQNGKNNTIKKIVTFDSLIQDIKTANQQHLINTTVALGLIAIVESAEVQAGKHPQTAIQILKGGNNVLNTSQGHAILISPDAYDVLINDFISLENSIK